MSRWKKTTGFNSRDRINKLLAELEVEIDMTTPNAERMWTLRRDLSLAYRDEEAFWRQRSIEEWLKAGDLNSAYFHNSVKGRKLRNRVLMLSDEQGIKHFSEGTKSHIAKEYFREFFMSTNPFELETLFEGFGSRVTQEMNERLVRPVTDDEICRAAFEIKGSSAPGKDGLTGVFYQKCWHIVGQQLSDEIRSFFQTSVIPA